MTFKVRRANPEDVPAVAPLFDAYRVFYGQEPDLDLAILFLRERLERAESVVFLAFDGEAGRATGFTQLYPLFSSVAARRRWLLNDLFVAPEARVRGVGGALLEAARRFAAESGAEGLELATAPDNFAAQRLYEATGWKGTPSYTTSWTTDGRYGDRWRTELMPLALSEDSEAV